MYSKLDYLKSFFLERTPGRRKLFFLLVDTILIVFSLWFAFMLRFDWHIPPEYMKILQYGWLLAIVTKLPMLYLWGCYRLTWAYVSVREIFNVLKASTTGSLIFGSLLFYLRDFPFLMGFPRSIPILDMILCFFFIGSFRSLKRVYLAFTYGKRFSGGKRTLIIGAGDAGEQLARSVLRKSQRSHYLIGFIDDHPNKLGIRIHGIKVLGSRRDLPHLVENYHVQSILIAIPSANSTVIRETVALAKEAGVFEVRTLPVYSELVTGKVSFRDIRDVQLKDLLGRKPVDIQSEKMARFFHGKTVLVTGAGGSIGSEMCRQLCRFRPRALILVDQDETGLFMINRELVELDSREIHPYLANVQDRARMRKILSDTRPHIIFHSAAYKHVIVMEQHPEEAVRNNVLGTKVMGELAIECGVERFVLISTDKAVNPTSVMGAAKRVAELLVTRLNRLSPTRFMSVRFGNVLGSRGSVIPIFRDQINRGGPITITDSKMKRYFMIPSEAVLLVFQAALMGEGGEVFVLDMGEPVRILDLAHELIKLSGLEPEKDIAIVYTGKNAGEKYFEDILTAEEGTSVTQNRQIFKAHISNGKSDSILSDRIDQLISSIQDMDHDKIRTLLKEIVPTYSSHSWS